MRGVYRGLTRWRWFPLRHGSQQRGRNVPFEESPSKMCRTRHRSDSGEKDPVDRVAPICSLRGHSYPGKSPAPAVVHHGHGANWRFARRRDHGRSRPVAMDATGRLWNVSLCNTLHTLTEAGPPSATARRPRPTERENSIRRVDARCETSGRRGGWILRRWQDGLEPWPISAGQAWKIPFSSQHVPYGTNFGISH